MHSGQKSYKCDLCLAKPFDSKANWLLHMHVTRGKDPFECNVCARTFMDKHNPIRHVRMHLDDKLFKCKHCNASFVQNYQLVIPTHLQRVPTDVSVKVSSTTALIGP
ncbi:hypothetical protein HPB48_019755 [Haemaphysalis longicornis]|uniref:C2H2-type domain-containing protein n=1 Tax=Haemaphysalis longicornis TaxID=44386 RepID=A0A9J6FLU1_HAELO|nr:hypothetical protein HPB48_019755 [Haemaphysalis longicornis]